MLLHARKTPLLDRAYAAYGRRLLRRAFAGVRVGGAAWPAGDGPTIAFLNHSAWWDPVVALFLARDVVGLDAYGLMGGAQLRRYPFFRRVGAFGTTAASPADARALAAYVGRLLRGGARRSVWIFPQGALLPARAPLAFRSGLARMARAVPEAAVVPVALRYELGADQRPECLVRVGEPATDAAHALDARAASARLARRLQDVLDRLDADHRDGSTARYPQALRGRESVSAFYDRTLGRLTGA